MRRRIVSFAVALGLALSAPALGAVAGRAPLACAATDQRAALVVDTGAGATSYCVALGAESVSGLDVIRLAHEQYGLDYRLGFGGRAVCSLAGVGVEGDDCFGAFPDFWGYWRGDGTGGWTWSSTGAADTTVEPGDVEGWSWGPGQDGSTHPMPPRTREDDVCLPMSPEPTPSPSGGGGGHEGGSGSGQDGGHDRGVGGSASGSPSSRPGASASPKPKQQQDGTTDIDAPASPSASLDASAAAAVRAAGPDDTDTGGAAGSLLAIAAILVLGAAGAWLIRRRRAGA
jgi:LPXTG-motif cell wall-anchored protein